MYYVAHPWQQEMSALLHLLPASRVASTTIYMSMSEESALAKCEGVSEELGVAEPPNDRTAPSQGKVSWQTRVSVSVCQLYGQYI